MLSGDAGLRIESGWQPGTIDRLSEMHDRYYVLQHGFGPRFRARVVQGLRAFVARLDGPRNGLWCAVRAGRVVGAIVIDGQDQADGAAHLRAFIVDGRERGRGVGGELLRCALRFADAKNFPLTRLWTFDRLQAARRLYEREGFRLIRSWPGDQWGTRVIEQVFERPIAAGAGPAASPQGSSVFLPSPKGAS